MDSDYSDEEIVENPTFKAAYNLEPLHHNQRLRWDHQVRLIGEKVFDPQIHLCEKCQYPILVYGRMLPCKHVFCLDCAKKYEKLCPRCDSRVQRIEQSALGTVFICTHGAPKHSVNGCRRTYLSKRDLQAHIAHRHSVKASSGPSGEESKSASLPAHHQQQHLISSSSLYDRHESSSRDRDSRSDSLRSGTGGGVDRDRGGAEQAVYRPIEGPPPAISTSHPPPPLAASHLQHPPPPAGVIRHPPPALHVQHPAGQLRMPMAPIQQQPPPTTMESYVTAQVQGMGGGGSGGGISRTNQNLITVPIHDEGADSYHTSRRQPEMSSYPGVPHTVPTAHPTAPPPAAYSSTPPPHLSMPPPGPFSSANLVGVGRIPFSTAPQQLVQAVAHLTHALSQQHRGVHPQRMNIPVSSAPPSRFPTQPPFTAGSPMHWSGAPPRQGQPPPRHQPPPGQRPPGDSGGYNQYY